jgi:hypothetical protein
METMIRKIARRKETDMSYTDWMGLQWEIKTCNGSPGVNPGNLLKFNQDRDSSKTILNQTTGQKWSEQCSYSPDIVSGTTSGGNSWTAEAGSGSP